MSKHSPASQKKYVRGDRYSLEGLQKIRTANYDRWLEKAINQHGEKFDYAKSIVVYRSQKTPQVPIFCNQHQIIFNVIPANHLRFASGGCPECKFEVKSRAKLDVKREKFLEWFQDNCADRLEILSEFKGTTKMVEFLCIKHRTKKRAKPANLMYLNNWACDQCSLDAQISQKVLKLDDVKTEFDKEMPSHVEIMAVRFDENIRQSLIVIQCEHHGEIEVTKGHLKRSSAKCPVCGNLSVGYAGNRLLQLLQDGEQGKPTWLGVIEIEVFGIRSLKVGITSRGLEKRYRWYLKKILFSVKLDELDALVLENRIKREFSNHHDLRILMAGMREGEQWPGDTECFWFKQKTPIISYINNFLDSLSEKEPDYWREFEDFEVPIFFPRDASREKDLSNLPQEVIAVNPLTGNIVGEFVSMSVAPREIDTSASQISKVISGKGNLAGGLRWFRAKGFSPDDIPAPQPHRLSRPVRCKETNKLYVSISDAARQTDISGSHIASVCKGKRAIAGGYTWEYADASYEEVLAQDQSDLLRVAPTISSNSPRPVEAIDPKTGAVVGQYDSISEAQRTTNISNINRVLRGDQEAAGGLFWRRKE